MYSREFDSHLTHTKFAPLADSNVGRYTAENKIANSADVAQLVEQLHGKEQVEGSNPFIGSFFVKSGRLSLVVKQMLCKLLTRVRFLQAAQ